MAGKKPTEADTRLGDKLRRIRIRRERTQRQVATHIGISAAQLQKYEKGTNRISATDLDEIAHFLGVPVTAFYESAQLTADPLTDERDAQIREHIGAIAALLAPPAGAEAA